MTLDEYLKQDGAKSLTAISVEVDVSKARLSQLRNSTIWPPELALRVEAATGGAVNASDLSPTVAKAREACAQVAAE